eukprot:6680968-Prymnesium_polylepis.1
MSAFASRCAISLDGELGCRAIVAGKRQQAAHPPQLLWAEPKLVENFPKSKAMVSTGSPIDSAICRRMEALRA